MKKGFCNGLLPFSKRSKQKLKIVQMEKHQINLQKQLDLTKQMKRALIFDSIQ